MYELTRAFLSSFIVSKVFVALSQVEVICPIFVLCI